MPNRKNGLLNSKRINEILKKTLSVIDEGKKEVFEIAENARKECGSINDELDNIKEKAKRLIKEVDKLEELEKRSRNRLLIVSKNFNKYTEDDIKEAYENANNLRIELMLKRQEEKDLLERRRELEIRFKNALDVVGRAEKLVTQVGVAMEYLSGNLDNIIETIEDMNKKQLLGIKIIQAQEEERQRVARDIHDGPAQSMANVVLKAEICERLLSIDIDKAKTELKNLKEVVRNSLKDVRNIIYDLRPMSLDDLGLIPTIQRYSHKFIDETGINVGVTIYGKEKKIDSFIEIGIFRIIQEALNNIRKHSKAKNAFIKVETTLNNINVVVEDDGKGFDPEDGDAHESDYSSGFGLMGMRERAELLGGRLGVKSEVGHGTKIIVIIPINGKEEYSED